MTEFVGKMYAQISDYKISRLLGHFEHAVAAFVTVPKITGSPWTPNYPPSVKALPKFKVNRVP